MLGEVAADLETRAVAVPGRSVPAALLEKAAEIDAGLVVAAPERDAHLGAGLATHAAHRLFDRHVARTKAVDGHKTIAHAQAGALRRAVGKDCRDRQPSVAHVDLDADAA